MQRSVVRAATGMGCSFLSLTALSGPVFAQPITFDDLEEHAVVADVHRVQTVRRNGKTFSVRHHQNWSFYVNYEHFIVLTLNTTLQTQGATRKTKPNFGSSALDEPQKLKSRGGGEAVWQFADGTLTFVRTFPSGAYRAHFAFVRSETGFTCTVTEGWAREGGKGEIRVESAFGGEVTVINSKQLPSTCKVAKRKQ